MSATQQNGARQPTAAELISDIGGKLADVMNTLALLSRIVPRNEPVITLPPRRKAPVVVQPAPVQMRPYRAAPVNVPAPVRRQPKPEPVPYTGWMDGEDDDTTRQRRTRRQGAAQRIVAALLSPTGVLASELPNIAGYPCGPTVLDRLAATHGFTWYETGTGSKRRYIGNVNRQARPQRQQYAAR